MVTITYAYFAPTIGLLFLLFLIKANHLFSKSQNKLFMLAAIVNIVLIVASAADLLLSKQQTGILSDLRRITSFINFAFGPAIPLLLFIIFRQKKNTFLLYVPLIINACLCFASIFVKVVFYIKDNNGYERGPLFFIPLITTFSYLGLMLLKPDDFHRQGRKTEQMFMLSIIVLIIISTTIEIKFYLYFITYSTTAIYLVSFYILKNIHYFMMDTLTGAYNRPAYQQKLSSLTRNQHFVIALLDINDFKFINDTYGHEEGDKALILFVDILHRHLKNFATLYRIGGDEFAVLSKKWDSTALEKALNVAELEIERNKLSFAYGISEYKITDDIQEKLRIADKHMYENKALMKKAHEIASDIK